MTNFILSILLLANVQAQTPSWATESFIHSVAARCSGESSSAVYECACTVRNRVNAGWNPNKVLSAYYAPDVRPTEQAVQDAVRGLSGIGCHDDWYFLMSHSDIKHLGWEVDDATGKAGGVLMFDREQWGKR